jgi:membrane-associated protease RseP (regulator of RpoE activity)
MSGPKHLWSGDWEQESAAVSEELSGRRVKPPEPEPAVPPPAPRRPRRRRFAVARRLGVRRGLLAVIAGVLALAAGALGLSVLLGSSGTPASTTAGGAPLSVAPTTASTSSRPVNWLGMEIETLPPGAAVVETVRLGSAGDRAGVEPGDAILEINNRRINGTSDIAPAIRGLHAGDVVSMQVANGSTVFGTQATLAAPPSAYP